MTIQRDGISITLNQETISKIDKERGYVPRSRYVEIALIEFLNQKPLKKGASDSKKKNHRRSSR